MVVPTHPSGMGLARGYADGPGGQVHFYDSGGGGTAVLLLHQSPAAATDYAGTMPFFAAAGVRVVAMDTPGMGMSDAPKIPPSIIDYADAAAAVINHLSIPAADIVGQHTGAQIAVEFAVKYPERARSLVLYGVPVMSAAEQADLWQRLVPHQKEGKLHKPAQDGLHIAEQYDRLFAHFGAVTAQRMTLSALMAGPLWWYGHDAALRHDIVPALRRVEQPLLLISHDGEMLDANSLAAAELRPDARLIRLAIDAPSALDADPAALVDAIVAFRTLVSDRSR